MFNKSQPDVMVREPSPEEIELKALRAEKAERDAEQRAKDEQRAADKYKNRGWVRGATSMTPAHRRRAFRVVQGGKTEPFDIFNPWFWMMWWVK